MTIQKIVLVMLVTVGRFALPLSHAAETPAQWLTVIEKQAAAEEAAWDAEWRDVMRGAALALEPYDGRPDAIAKVSGERKRTHDAYLRVWDQHARAVADKLLSGRPVSELERKYRFLHRS